MGATYAVSLGKNKSWGECVMSTRPNGLHVDHPDPRIRISAELIGEIRDGRCSSARIEKHEGYSELLTIEATNRTVVYVIGEYRLAPDLYECHWPD